MSTRSGTRWASVTALGTLPASIPLLAFHGDQRWAGVLQLGLGATVGAVWVRGRVPLVARFGSSLAGLAIAALAVRPIVGFTPVAVAALAMLAALLPAARGAVGDLGPARALLLGGAAMAWIATRSLPMTVGLIGAALALVVAGWRAPNLGGCADRAVRVAARALGSAASVAVIAAVSLIVVYLPAALARPVRSLSRRRTVGWSDPNTIEPEADANRPFSSSKPAVRHRRNGLGAAAIASAIALVIVVVDRREKTDPPDSSIPVPILPADGSRVPGTAPVGARVPLAERPAFVDAPWAADLEREFEAYGRVGATSRDGAGASEGRYLNVADGARSTLLPTCECPSRTIWLLGGSAAFGWDQRDHHTIASDLVRLGERDGIRLTVENFGVPGWTIHDEVERLQQLLSERSAPDLVVFYDGFNDLVGALAAAAASGNSTPAGHNSFDAAEVESFSRSRITLDRAGGPDRVATDAATRYTGVIDHARTLLTQRGVTVRFVLQTDAFASRRQLEFQEDIIGVDADRASRSQLAVALDTFETAVAPAVLNVRRTIAEVNEPIFADVPHTNELGAQLAASAIWNEISDLPALGAHP